MLSGKRKTPLSKISYCGLQYKNKSDKVIASHYVMHIVSKIFNTNVSKNFKKGRTLKK